MAFFLVFAAACLIMGSGLRTQVVEVLIKAGAPPELITAVSPDMVLGESLSSAPTIQAVREVPATVEGPVQADKDEDAVSGNPSPIQSAIESAVESTDSAFVPSRARAAAQKAVVAKAAVAKAADRRASAAQDRARTDRGPARAAPAARPAARPVVVRQVVRQAPEPAPKPASAKGPGKAAPATDHGGKPGDRLQLVASRDQTVTTQTRGPERRATGSGASRQAAPAKSNRNQHGNRGRGHASRRDFGRASGPDRSSHSLRHHARPQVHRGSQRGPGGGGHHVRGGHGPSGHRH